MSQSKYSGPTVARSENVPNGSTSSGPEDAHGGAIPLERIVATAKGKPNIHTGYKPVVYGTKYGSSYSYPTRY